MSNTAGLGGNLKENNRARVRFGEMILFLKYSALFDCPLTTPIGLDDSWARKTIPPYFKRISSRSFGKPWRVEACEGRKKSLSRKVVVAVNIA
jgi:hypothetical protein